MKRILILVCCVAIAAAQAVHAAEVKLSQRGEELQKLRFGMFVCWSFSTFSGKEWTPGVKDASFFKATGCDTEQWARTAKEAQMGYILFLAKHHDGFCLWDTKTTDRKVTKSPLGRDVLRELKRSCDKHGVKLALYFSEGDWTWPGAVDGQGGNGGGRNPEAKKAQLKELLTEYGPVEYLWFDHAVGDGGLSHRETLAWCKSLQPGCFVGFNHGDQEGADIRLGEMGRPGPLGDHAAAGPYMKDAPSKNYQLAEFTYPILPPHEGGAMWFYSLPKHDALCLPSERLYRDYLGAARFGNLFALDVGPDYAGRLRAVDVQTLRKVGEMIRAGAPDSSAPPTPKSPPAAQAAPTMIEIAEEQPPRKPVRYGSVIGLRAEKLEEYKMLHAAVWPKVAEALREAHVRNYSIYLRKLPDGKYYLFSYLEYVGEDFKADMQRTAANPEVKRWWTVTDPCQEPLGDRKPGEWWASMEEVFHQD
jgi:alpha-L-fucosidase